MSVADIYFKRQLREIKRYGYSDAGQEVRPIWEDGESAHTTYITHNVNSVLPFEGVPIQTGRRIPWKLALREILAIYQKHATTKQEFHDMGIKWWDSWFDERGSLGTSYAYQLKKVIPFPEGGFTQFDRVLWLLKNKPMDRRIITNMLNLEEMYDMALPPCAFMTMWAVRGDSLDLMLVQRSGDMIPAAGFGGVNTIQYYLLLAMVAQVTGYEIGKFTHVVNNLHVYDKHMQYVPELLYAENFDEPELVLNKEVKNFYDFKEEDIELVNYKYDKTIKDIPIAI